ncbi:hypothetical protein PI125_g23023 [Phytophthora idaei]|nr:hypothetical protein PI125_g23023 [Phytophthora idaei]
MLVVGTDLTRLLLPPLSVSLGLKLLPLNVTSLLPLPNANVKLGRS